MFSSAAGRTATAHRLGSANEGAHEFSVDLRCNRVHINALTAEESACIIDVVDPRGFNADILKACSGEFRSIVIFLEGAGNAADPQQNPFADFRMHRATRDYIRYGKTAAGLKDTESFAKNAILIGREIDDAIRNDDVN